MATKLWLFRKDIWLLGGIIALLIFSNLMLFSAAPYLFPDYYAYIIVGLICLIIFSAIDFEIYEAFSTYLYSLSLALLIFNFIMGEVTRGVVRWITIGPYTIQPSEMVRPFLILFFAVFMTQKLLTIRRFIKALIAFSIPAILILLQPSLGVTVLLAVGFAGVTMSLDFDKRILLTAVLFTFLFMPLSWFILAPYQKGRILALLNPTSDPYGAGYNSIQAQIAVGSGKLTGRGLGEGVQTQLSFLPERHTDFIFASISEELGSLGSVLIILLSFFILWRLINIIGRAKTLGARAFVSGVFLTMFVQIFVHIGMNMGIMPITGIPLPLVSAGGSSLVATMIMLGMCISAKKG